MKITSLLVLKCIPEGPDAIILANASDVSHFSYFKRPSVREFIVFFARTVAKRTPSIQRKGIRLNISAFGFLYVVDEYQKEIGESWRNVEADALIVLNLGLIWMSLWSNSSESLSAVCSVSQREDLEEFLLARKNCNVIVLARGEKLDNLVEKSSDLSAAFQFITSFLGTWGCISLKPRVHLSIKRSKG
ncbi:hypothetical protein F3Y22_tig00111238pilonHSYRG00388 [Hibiscus syriacus]|uniref:Uncharacterized protein n=1 Tax=Hibiscus syriacus TaxID=106335 RepID=A0A6A2YTH6_HIBSY|nr:hypothetical protein F3Y22_tig00111238pilonHSYRG00388 [Hibiscus syriacus]